MNKPKKFKLRADEIQQIVRPMGGCFATDHIAVEGMHVGFMYREAPDNEIESGWRFLSGTETQDYMDDSNNTSIYEVNTIANYDPAIIPYLDCPEGTELEREPGTHRFRIVK